MPWLIGSVAIWIGSKVVVNATESVENVAGAGNKLARGALMAAGAAFIYFKVLK